MTFSSTCRLTGFAIGILVCAPSARPAARLGITITADIDCVVEVDGNLVTRLSHAVPGLVPATAGLHKISAATVAGDYFEATVEVKGDQGAALAISFADVRTQRAAAVKKVEAMKDQLEQIRLALSRRRLIVEAVNYYSDRWGREIGLLEQRDQNVRNAEDTQQSLVLQNAGNIGNTNAEAANGYAMLGTWIYKKYQEKKAHRNDLAAGVAKDRMDYLRKALEDPTKYPPEDEKGDYLAIVRSVKRGKAMGSLSLSPTGIQYSDSGLSVRMSCSEVLGASGGSTLTIRYATANSRKSLSLQPIKKAEGPLIGGLYVACPKLTQ
jgi:hypothetical protein